MSFLKKEYIKHKKLLKNCNNLTYQIKGLNTSSVNFIDFRGALHIYNEIKNGNMSIKKLKKIKTNLNKN